MNKEVLFFPNGNVAVFEDGVQRPELQAKSWIVLFAEFLESQGRKPEEYDLLLPGGTQARFLRTAEGNWNWRVL